jgi:hypothetical protein
MLQDNPEAAHEATPAVTQCFRDDRCVWLHDTELDDAARHMLAEFLVPRRGLAGSLVWPIDEVAAGENPNRE